MTKAPGLLKLQQGKILAYENVKMTVRAIAKAVGRSKSAVHAFLKDPDGYGTKKSPGRPRQLKTHGRTRLRRYAATREYTANELQKKLCIDASVRIMQWELQHCEHLAYEKANKSPCMAEHHMKLRVKRQLRNRTDWSRVVFSDEKKLNLDGPDGCNTTDTACATTRKSRGAVILVVDP